MNVSLVPRRDGNGRTIPFEKTLIDPVDVLNDGKLEMQSRFLDWFSNRFAELRNDHLFGLVNGIEAPEQRAQNREHQRDQQEPKAPPLSHLFSGSFGLSGRIASKFRIDSSMRIFSPVAGRASPICSR